MARIKGSAFYVETAYPRLPVSVAGGRMWSLAHGITRQESSFDRAAVSHAGARGMMQLMPGTAREQAGKMGVGYDGYRLITDPSYNVMLGTAYFQRMLNIWDGSVPLAVASYNAGSGNVGKWVRAYGDPRGRTDVLNWIERIPYSETKAYVQRVIENSVVYDRMNPHNPPQDGSCLELPWEGRPRLKRPHEVQPRFITAEGFSKLRSEYEELFAIERPKLVETIAWAAANGDRSENGDYIYGRKKLREIDRRLGTSQRS